MVGSPLIATFLLISAGRAYENQDIFSTFSSSERYRCMMRYSSSELGVKRTPLPNGLALGACPILSLSALKWVAQLGKASTIRGGKLGFDGAVSGGGGGHPWQRVCTVAASHQCAGGR